MEIVNADMREFWNGRGSEKWLRFEQITDSNLLPFGRKAMAAANILSGESVLDVGCGCGDTTLEIARAVESGGRVLGVDISAPLLARAKTKALSRTGTNATFEIGDAQVLQFEADSFDLVFSRFGVMFFDDAVAAFKNFRRALRPGGRLVFVCWQTARNNAWMSLPLDVVSRHVPLPAPSGPDEPGPLSLSDPGRVSGILATAGFQDVTVDGVEMTFTVGGMIDEAANFLTQLGPAGAAIAQSDADDALQSRILADLRDALTPHDTGQGVALGAAVWIVTAGG